MERKGGEGHWEMEGLESPLSSGPGEVCYRNTPLAYWLPQSLGEKQAKDGTRQFMEEQCKGQIIT